MVTIQLALKETGAYLNGAMQLLAPLLVASIVMEMDGLIEMMPLTMINHNGMIPMEMDGGIIQMAPTLTNSLTIQENGLIVTVTVLVTIQMHSL